MEIFFQCIIYSLVYSIGFQILHFGLTIYILTLHDFDSNDSVEHAGWWTDLTLQKSLLKILAL